jgi:hypothetical protein
MIDRFSATIMMFAQKSLNGQSRSSAAFTGQSQPSAFWYRWAGMNWW